MKGIIPGLKNKRRENVLSTPPLPEPKIRMRGPFSTSILRAPIAPKIFGPLYWKTTSQKQSEKLASGTSLPEVFNEVFHEVLNER